MEVVGWDRKRTEKDKFTKIEGRKFTKTEGRGWTVIEEK